MTNIPALVRPRENGDPVAAVSRRWAEQIAAEYAELVEIKPWSPYTGDAVAGDDRLGALIVSLEPGTDGLSVPVWTYVAACEWVPGRLEIRVQVYGNNSGGRTGDFMAVDGAAPIVAWVRRVMPGVVEQIDVPRARRAATAARGPMAAEAPGLAGGGVGVERCG